MNAERILDALNELDEDLVAQTDEVRRGVRVLYRPRVWGAAAAACTVLVLAGAMLMPRMMEDSAGNLQDMEPAEHAYGYSASGATEYREQVSKTTAARKTVTVGSISVSIPADWEWARLDTNEEWGSHVALSHGEKGLIIGYYPSFGVCGTGLEQQSVTIAGLEAHVGTYDGKKMWDFIRFSNDYVVLNQSGEAWTEEERAEIVSVLESLTFEMEDAQ